MTISLSQSILSKAEQQAGLFRVFGNPTRLLILWLLEEGEKTLIEIATTLGIAQSNAYHHLRILMFHNLVFSREHQETTYYQLVDRETLLNCRIFANKPQELLTEVS